MVLKTKIFTLVSASAVLLSGTHLSAQSFSPNPAAAQTSIGVPGASGKSPFSTPTIGASDSRIVSKLYRNARRHLNNGDYNLAIVDLEKALRFAPQNAHLNYTIGGAYYALSNNDRAISFLEKTLASDVDPIPDNLRTIAQKMLAEIQT